MRKLSVLLPVLAVLSCSGQSPYDPAEALDELDPATVLDAPRTVSGEMTAAQRAQVERGEYLVELLGCGTCHTQGAFDGEPDVDRPLAGSGIGIAYTSPLDNPRPGVVFPPNLTPDEETGVGGWSDAELVDGIRRGTGRHGGARSVMMPWPAYAKLSDEDAAALVAYLRSLPAVHHRVPARVQPGQSTRHPYVYFGIYRDR